MVRTAIRAVFCVLIGVVSGRILGSLFVPDPTGALAAVLTIVVAAVVSTALYRSDWLRERKSILQ